MKLTFTSIKKGTIFNDEFLKLTPENGSIEFKHMRGAGGLAVVYAPNGTGKSSLADLLKISSASEDTFFLASDDNCERITPESGAFHIIHDQLNRNIIQGRETDYLIGDQIRREYELRDYINTSFATTFTNLNGKYKNDFKVSKVGDFLLEQIGKEPKHSLAHSFIRDLVKTQSKGKAIDIPLFVDYIRDNSNRPNLVELDPEKRQFIIEDCSKSKIVERILGIPPEGIIANELTIQIERHEDAIALLHKYHDLDSCVVCDNPNFDGNSLLERKTERKKRIYDSLDSSTKELLDKVVRDRSLDVNDPFEIKRIVRNTIAGDDSGELEKLQIELKTYVHAIGNEMIEILFHCFDDTQFYAKYDEYNALTEIDPKLDNEELLFIQEIINDNIGRDITIERDDNSRNYKLKIGDTDLIGANPQKLQLSAGEQNFISLSFDLLFARRSKCPYIILDDPISSFDSVYKNKIAFCIIKFLENKKQIVLTHNLDLIRLLNVQLNNCFNLYILNRVDGGRNGFIPVNQQEKQLLINLHDLVRLFQGKTNRGETFLYDAIRNRKDFLMAMIPFLRGYAHISLDPNDYYGQLSGIMHGYNNGSLDIIPIYKALFGYEFSGTEIISVDDILNVDYKSINVLDSKVFPLLSETLRQTLVYYHLRMYVEKELTDLFAIRIDDSPMLSQVISRALDTKGTDPDKELKLKYKVFFNSRKTLLNEFNHFEGNLNIFQPAIDINPEALNKEITDIKNKLKELRTFVTERTV